MAKAKSHLPSGYHALTPHVVVRGAAGYIDFLKKAFGAEEVGRFAGPDGKIMHAEVHFAGSKLMLSDHFPEHGAEPIAEGNWPMVLTLYVPDADAVWKKALETGCTVRHQLADQFWGDRYGQVRDPYGFVWAIATHKEDLSREEMMERQKKAFGAGG